jgi:predicted metal-binding membrane protein
MRMAAMSQGGGMAMPMVWSAGWIVPTFIMWAIMMVAMMLPSAAPAITLYGSMVRKNRQRGSVLPSVWIFTAGYLAVCTGFSLLVTLLQAALQDGGLVTPMMASGSHALTGVLLLVAGVYQWLPFKDACLDKCRDPLQLFLFRWQPGALGTFRMGVEHGAYCTGCCWALMLLLFTAGVMNLLWVALIAGFVLVEKLLPAPAWTARLAGVVMMGAGVYVLLPL